MINTTIRRAAACAMLLCAAGAAQALQFTLTDLGVLGDPNASNAGSRAYAINASGQVAGVVDLGTGAAAREYGFIWANGTMTALTSFDGAEPYGSFAYGINDAGVVVGQGYLPGATAVHGIQWQGNTKTNLSPAAVFGAGTAINASGQVAMTIDSRAVRYSGGIHTVLPTLGGTLSSAAAINVSGHVVGESALNNDLDFHAARWVGNVAEDLGTLPGGTFSAAFGINAAGTVVGYGDSATNHVSGVPVLWKNGQVTQLGSLGGTAGEGYAINNNEWVVGGSWITADAREHAALWLDGNTIDLNTALVGGLGDFSYLEVATALNDAGQIVGYGKLTSGKTRAFLLNPVAVPEPETYALMLVGLGLLGAVARRRRAALQ